MHIPNFFLILIASNLAHSRSIKRGVFDNVTVLVQNSTSPLASITIEFDDLLEPYVQNPEIIQIQKQNVPKLEPNSISNLPTLKKLILSHNGIREIQRGAFQNVPSLRILNLSFNQIEEVSHGVFNNMTLTHLLLDNNKIHRIAYKAFSHMTLSRLLLQKNRITRWSRDWLADSFVKVLDLRFNLIEELPQFAFSMMAKPANAKWSIFMGHNQVKKIPRDVFNGFEYYKRIYLDSNSIDRLDPDSFNGVKYVNVLNLNNNSLTDISNNLFNTTGIDILMLEDNKLRCISTNIFKMEELDIDGNPITCSCVKSWLDWRDRNSNPSIYHITNLEQECI